MKRVFIIFAMFFAIAAFAEDDLYENIDIEDAKELYKEGAIFIDVRMPTEFIHAGHGLGHINIPILFQEFKLKPLNIREKFAEKEREGKKLDARKLYTVINRDNPDFVKEVMKVTKRNLEAEIVLLCHSGQRSAYAAKILAKEGFENVYNLEGGFLEWKANNLPWSID